MNNSFFLSSTYVLFEKNFSSEFISTLSPYGNKLLIIYDEQEENFLSSYLVHLKDVLEKSNFLHTEIVLKELKNDEALKKIAKIFTISQSDFILAFGNQQTINLIKGISFLVSDNDSSLGDYLYQIQKKSKDILIPPPPVFIIPTELMSLTETNSGFTLGDRKNNLIGKFYHDFSLPYGCFWNYSILESYDKEKLVLSIIYGIGLSIDGYISFNSSLIIKEFCKATFHLLQECIAFLNESQSEKSRLIEALAYSSLMLSYAKGSHYGSSYYTLTYILSTLTGIQSASIGAMSCEYFLDFHLFKCAKSYLGLRNTVKHIYEEDTIINSAIELVDQIKKEIHTIYSVEMDKNLRLKYKEKLLKIDIQEVMTNTAHFLEWRNKPRDIDEKEVKELINYLTR